MPISKRNGFVHHAYGYAGYAGYDDDDAIAKSAFDVSDGGAGKSELRREWVARGNDGVRADGCAEHGWYASDGSRGERRAKRARVLG